MTWLLYRIANVAYRWGWYAVAQWAMESIRKRSGKDWSDR